ncbi:MAG: BtpA/SgcQ family protein [Phycisphaerae bacterium]|nr:BtpA/SgcQ family protein [Phycisphaerae bacterium]
MVHLPALPTAANHAGGIEPIIERAVREARTLQDAGFDALFVENFGDAPFHADRVPPPIIAAMTAVVCEVVRAVRIPVGVNVLRNDAVAALSIAAAAGASFIRVNVLSGVCATDQGILTGRADEALPLRNRLCPNVQIAADVHVKHAVPISQPDLALAAEETAYRAGADILIVSGPSTGRAADGDSVETVRGAVPDRPIWIGSGVTPETARDWLVVADGLIVGTCLKRGGRTTAPLDAARVRALVAAARSWRD